MAQLMPAPLNAEAADRVRTAAGIDLPDELRTTTDHLAVLRHLVDNPEALTRAETEATAAEVKCARTCQPAPWLHSLLADTTARSIPWAVVTNNSADAVRAFLDRHAYPPPRTIQGRTVDNVRRLKPDPRLVTRGVHRIGIPPTDVAFVGDSVSDVAAGLAAGVRMLAYAKNDVRGAALLTAGAHAAVLA